MNEEKRTFATVNFMFLADINWNTEEMAAIWQAWCNYQLLSYAISLLPVSDLKGDIFWHTIYPTSAIVMVFYSCKVMEEGER